jgi:hypothetical protein
MNNLLKLVDKFMMKIGLTDEERAYVHGSKLFKSPDYLTFILTWRITVDNLKEKLTVEQFKYLLVFVESWLECLKKE